jgi:hypothetical protein
MMMSTKRRKQKDQSKAMVDKAFKLSELTQLDDGDFGPVLAEDVSRKKRRGNFGY